MRRKRQYAKYLNDESIDVLPPWASDKISERLSRVVSLYFSQHPEEYEEFLSSREKKEKMGE